MAFLTAAGALAVFYFLKLGPRPHAWWSIALIEFACLALLGVGFVDAYLPWAIGGVDDPVKERKRVLTALAVVGTVVPALIVLGIQGYGVGIERSPGTWPREFDSAARILLTGLSGFVAILLPIGIVRRHERRVKTWLIGAFCEILLIGLAAWPWVDTRDVAMSLRQGLMLSVLGVIAVLGKLNRRSQ